MQPSNPEWLKSVEEIEFFFYLYWDAVEYLRHEVGEVFVGRENPEAMRSLHGEVRKTLFLASMTREEAMELTRQLNAFNDSLGSLLYKERNP